MRFRGLEPGLVLERWIERRPRPLDFAFFEEFVPGRTGQDEFSFSEPSSIRLFGWGAVFRKEKKEEKGKGGREFGFLTVQGKNHQPPDSGHFGAAKQNMPWGRKKFCGPSVRLGAAQPTDCRELKELVAV